MSELKDQMHPSVKKVVPKPDFTLAITFHNREEGILDMKPYLHFGVFQRLADYERFKAVHVSFDTVAWDCGVDLDPEFIYAQCKKVTNA